MSAGNEYCEYCGENHGSMYRCAAFDKALDPHLKKTGDKMSDNEKCQRAFGELTDKQMASKVRMLMRKDLDHEAVCVGARDRILDLSADLKALQDKIAELEAIIENAYPEPSDAFKETLKAIDKELARK